MGFDGVIRARRDRADRASSTASITTSGIPRRIAFLPAPFDADDLDGKAAAKRALLETFRLHRSPMTLLARPVIGMVSRMVDQKGLDLIAAVGRATCRRSTRPS